MNFNELMSTTDPCTPEQATFISVHTQILHYGQVASHALVEIATKLKQMRDDKLYQAADFATFGEYVEKACGIKERQAYNYISVLERLPRDFLQSNAKFGVTKLVMLSGLTEQERDEIVNQVDVENATVRELRDAIAEKENRIKQLQADLESATNSVDNTALTEAQAKVDELTRRLDKKEKDRALAINQFDKANAQVTDLRRKLDESTAREAAAKKEYEEKYQQAMAEAGQKVAADNTAEIAALQAELDKAKRMASLAAFKVKYTELQRVGDEAVVLLAEMDEGSKPKCMAALRAAIGDLVTAAGITL